MNEERKAEDHSDRRFLIRNKWIAATRSTTDAGR